MSFQEYLNRLFDEEINMEELSDEDYDYLFWQWVDAFGNEIWKVVK